MKYDGESGTRRILTLGKGFSLVKSISGAAIADAREDDVKDFEDSQGNTFCRGRTFHTCGRAEHAHRTVCANLAGSQAAFMLRSRF